MRLLRSVVGANATPRVCGVGCGHKRWTAAARGPRVGAAVGAVVGSRPEVGLRDLGGSTVTNGTVSKRGGQKSPRPAVAVDLARPRSLTPSVAPPP
jgi:hypothetical protein